MRKAVNNIIVNKVSSTHFLDTLCLYGYSVN